MNYYSFHIGDYRRDTMHFSMLEHGAYRQLLDWLYLDEKPIPKETEVVFRRLSAKTNEEQNAIQVVLKEMFSLTDDGYVQGRCMCEITTYKGQAARARENGKLGGRPKKTIEVIVGLDKTTHTKANQEPLTTNHLPLTSKKKKSPSRGITLGEFLKDCEEKGKDAIPESDPIFEYAKSIGLPCDFLYLGWSAFKTKQADDKRQVDWRKTFRNYVKSPDWIGVWKLNRDGEYYLTDAGKQLERELRGVTE